MTAGLRTRAGHCEDAPTTSCRSSTRPSSTLWNEISKRSRASPCQIKRSGACSNRTLGKGGQAVSSLASNCNWRIRTTWDMAPPSQTAWISMLSFSGRHRAGDDGSCVTFVSTATSWVWRTSPSGTRHCAQMRNWRAC